MAFVARDSANRKMIWVRPLESLLTRSLAGTEGAMLPSWSADRRFIGFFADGKLEQTDVSGAPPQWRRDGKELCYVTPNGQLMAVAVNLSGPSFEQGIPAPLFATAPDFCDAPNRYTVSRDGKRFLVNTAVEGTSTQPLEVVLNLTEELSRH